MMLPSHRGAPPPHSRSAAYRVGLARRPPAGRPGLVTESTLEAFSRALAIGVTTLELDVRLIEDGQALVTHVTVKQPLAHSQNRVTRPHAFTLTAAGGDCSSRLVPALPRLPQRSSAEPTRADDADG
jgi:glycerophosphoryl diester phosphodiesterase